MDNVDELKVFLAGFLAGTADGSIRPITFNYGQEFAEVHDEMMVVRRPNGVHTFTIRYSTNG